MCAAVRPMERPPRGERRFAWLDLLAPPPYTPREPMQGVTMRRALLLALLALPLAGFDCGGPDEPQAVPCTVTVAGGATETLWCIVAVYDYSQLSPPSTEWALDLVAYRSMTEPGVGVGFFLPTRAVAGTAYGWH